MSKEAQNELANTVTGAVVARDNSQQSAALIYGGDSSVYYCSLPADDPARDEVLMKCAFSPDTLVKDCVGQDIDLRHVYGTRVSIANAITGEIDECTHTVLIDKNNRTYACTSKGIAKSIALLIQSRGTPDTWKRSVRVQVIRVRAKIGDMLALRVLPEVNNTSKQVKS